MTARPGSSCSHTDNYGGIIRLLGTAWTKSSIPNITHPFKPQPESQFIKPLNFSSLIDCYLVSLFKSQINFNCTTLWKHNWQAGKWNKWFVLPQCLLFLFTLSVTLSVLEHHTTPYPTSFTASCIVCYQCWHWLILKISHSYSPKKTPKHQLFKTGTTHILQSYTLSYRVCFHLAGQGA